MRVPLSWLREHAALPDDVSGRDVAERLIAAGLEVETVDAYGADVEGPVVIGRVVEFEEFEASNGKTIRWCQVDVGEPAPRGIVCGARNFAAGDRVVVALPGAVLPGGFAISARKTYGHVSDGMICSARELGVGDDHTGIIVLDAGAPVGADALVAAGLRDDVLDIAVTPDRGYCLSIRGVAREAAIAYGVDFSDPAGVSIPPAVGEGPEVAIDDPSACDRFVLRAVSGFDPHAPSPWWMRLRLTLAGVRPISLAVDVTNYVLLELGQPLHAFDASQVHGPVVVRRAAPGEKLETIDHVARTLDAADVVVSDSSGALSLAGTMGGVSSEIGDTSTDLLIEAAHFPAVEVARMSRRHKLSSESSRRFERGVDPALPPAAAGRAVALLLAHGGGTAGGMTDINLPRKSTVVSIAADHPDQVAGVAYGADVVTRRLQQVGCDVSARGDVLTVTPPSWRPDLSDPNDLAEEVIRLEGYDAVPSLLPPAPPGRGLTEGQRIRRRVGRALAYAGYVEVLTPPFTSASALDALGIPDGDPRRAALQLANPLSDEEPLLRTTLLPGLLEALHRNVGRGQGDVALFEMGLVYRAREGAPQPPRLPVDHRPSDDEIAGLLAALPDQPLRAAVVLAGERESGGWWASGRAATWADAVEAVRTIAAAVGVSLDVESDDVAPWHPGRCATIRVHGTFVGHAGELHPRVLAALELPPRTCAAEIDLSALLDATAGERGPVRGPVVSTFPVATQDVALVVDVDVPAAAVEAALRSGAGELLESVRLFDVYTGDQIGEGKKSLAYALRFRAPDRTLTAEEATAARDAAVSETARRVGAVLRT